MSPFVRKVRTASGATAVQIVEKLNGRRRIVEHIGSARDEAELVVLVSAAQQRLHGSQDMLEFEVEPKRRPAAGPLVEDSRSEVLWQVLTGAYRALGFDAVADEVFGLLVAARIIEPTSKLDTLRVLSEIGVGAPHENTLYNCLARCVERDYRSQGTAACWKHANTAGPVGLVMYDRTTLHLEITDEDRRRRVGISKEHRVDQTPILTNRTDLTAGEVAYRMSNRWRQENYFKYAREHFALDALDSYADTPDDPTRLVPNPAKALAVSRIAAARTHLDTAHADLAQALDDAADLARRP